MVPRASGHLTRIGFRRDVKLFLAALVGYLIVMILALLLILQNFLITTVQISEASWDTISEMVVRDIDRIGAFDRSEIHRHLSFFRENADFLSAELTPPGQEPIRSGFDAEQGRHVTTSTRHGKLRIQFDDSLVRHERAKFKWIAIIVIVSTFSVTLLLVLYLPKIVRPIEEMLDHAREIEDKAEDVDEARYLVDTFRRSIDTLNSQKEELARLHAVEKSRADDLERVTSTLTRSIASGFIAVDDAGTIIEMNRVARDVLGIDPEPGSRLDLAIPPGPFAEDLLRGLDSREGLTRHETSHPGPAGDIAIGLTTVPLRDENDLFLGMIAIFADLSPIRSLEARVRDLQTLADLGEISAGIAHEFRNSLSTVLGYLRLAARNEEPAASREKLEAAEREARLLSEAVSKLLAFSRPIEPDFSNVELHVLATEVVSKLKDEAGDGVELAIDSEPALVRGDASLLRVVIENLVRNAVDAVHENSGEGRVALVVRTEDTFGTLTVRDNGPGVDEKDIQRLFLPFQSGKPGGFGLGLALSKKIVLLHEGSISLERDDAEMVATIRIPIGE